MQDLPLLRLLNRLQLADDAKALPSETALVKAIREHASDVLDVRMSMLSPSRAEWYGRNMSGRDNTGGYEVRLKDWKEAILRAGNTTRQDWEARTIYIVRGIRLNLQFTLKGSK